ncbi:MAG: lysophospholipid acyltransferase family protein [Planctomycetota bacterium]
MQNILIEKPYEFHPPYEWNWPQRFLTQIGQFKPLLRKEHGVTAGEVRNIDRLKKSIAAGYGIMLCPNHPRTADPIAMYYVCQQCPVSLYTMASWHLFNQSRFMTFMLRLMGAFSVNREGLDRKSVDFAIDTLVQAKRPLLIFPSGSTSRTNDRLMAFMDGPSFIARTAAKRRKKNGEKVVVHPICIKYFYQGDIEAACLPVLDEIEKRLTWSPNRHLPLIDRIIKIGDALLTLKELQCGIRSADGLTLRQRQSNMVNRLLNPLEKEWLGKPQDGGIQTRVKNLRMKIFPDLARNEVDDRERKRRWAQLENTYLAQQVDCYPENYLVESPSVDRILETVEKFEEDIKDKCRIHGDLKVVLNIGEAIEVSTKRDREATADPLMTSIRQSVQVMLDEMQFESKLYQPAHAD